MSDASLLTFDTCCADKLLPLLPVYKEKVSSMDAARVHLDEKCGGGAPTWRPYRFVVSDRFCTLCHVEADSLAAKLKADYELLEKKRTGAKNIEKYVKFPSPHIDFRPEVMARILTQIDELATSWVPELENSNFLQPLSVTFTRMFDELKSLVLTYLKSDDCKSLLVAGCGGYEGRWDKKYNSLLYMLGTSNAFDRSITEAYAQEVSTGRFLATGPPEILGALHEYNASTPVNIPKSTPIEVLETMAALWEPEASTALGDGSKALEAAWVLTSKQM